MYISFPLGSLPYMYEVRYGPDGYDLYDFMICMI